MQHDVGGSICAVAAPLDLPSGRTRSRTMVEPTPSNQPAVRTAPEKTPSGQLVIHEPILLWLLRAFTEPRTGANDVATIEPNALAEIHCGKRWRILWMNSRRHLQSGKSSAHGCGFAVITGARKAGSQATRYTTRQAKATPRRSADRKAARPPATEAPPYAPCLYG